MQILRGVRIPSLVLSNGPRVLVSTREIRSVTPFVGRCVHSTEESDTDVECWQANLTETGIQQLQGSAAIIVRRDCFDAPNATQS